MYILYDDYLMHYGVKGMKWGIRRYQNADGSYKPGARGRYDDDPGVQKAKSELNAAKKRRFYDPKRESEIDYAKREVKDAKDRVRMKTHEMSDREKILIKEYTKQGYSRKEAELRAYQRARNEKILKVAAGVTVAAVGVYLARRGVMRNVDKVVKVGTAIQNVNSHGATALKDGFYGAMKAGDKLKYQGIYGATLRKQRGDVTKTVARATENLKIASPKSARKVMADLAKNDSKYMARLKIFIDSEAEAMASTPGQMRLIKRAQKDISKGKVTKAVHDVQNMAYAVRNDGFFKFTPYLSKRYGESLKKAGYSGVKDVNDMFYSGFKTKMPTIFLDASKVKVESATKIADKTINRKQVVGLAQTMGPYAVGAVAAYTAPGMAVREGVNSARVRSYRKAHPNTKLSNNEISRMLDQKR